MWSLLLIACMIIGVICLLRGVVIMLPILAVLAFILIATQPLWWVFVIVVVLWIFKSKKPAVNQEP